MMERKVSLSVLLTQGIQQLREYQTSLTEGFLESNEYQQFYYVMIVRYLRAL